ncbi:hypothetical protein BYT27DRAFT_7249360 [Phlegmacium glaucopus]|nr:hypothetical protein BYT27DRAFT_7249360 [Phlegmacium glaucopus]
MSPVISRTPTTRGNPMVITLLLSSRYLPLEHHQTCFLRPRRHPLVHKFKRNAQQQMDSESFMSVSAHEDHLSLLLPSSNSSLVPVLLPVSSPPPTSVVPTSSQSSYHPTRPDNTSLTFFDKFAEDAKRNSEIRWKGLVDELLKCEDNPLYLLHHENETTQTEGQEDQSTTFDDGKQSTSDPELQTSSPSSLLPVDAVLHDLDLEYFSSGHLVNINTCSDNDETSLQSRLSDPSHPRSPSKDTGQRPGINIWRQR